MTDRFRKLLGLALIVTLVSLGATACNRAGDHPSDGHSTDEHQSEHPE